jgi:mono/diheme cytochrome c family protein
MPKTLRMTHLPPFTLAFAAPSATRCLLLSALLCGALPGCEQRVTPTREWQASDHVQPAQADPDRTPTPTAPEEGGTERAADALYNVSCAGCHGRDGRGQGPQRPPGAPLPDFTDPKFQAQRTDAQLLQVLREGRGLMPPFGKQLNDQGLGALIAKVRRFGAGEGAAPPAAAPNGHD